MKEKRKHTGFGTPEGYFDDFEERLFTKLSEGHIPKNGGFKTPDGYFDRLEKSILQHVERSKHKRKVIPLFTRRTIIYAASIAACAIVIFSLMDTTQSASQFEDIDITTIESYIEEGMLGYDLNDVTALLDEEDIIEFNPIEDHLSDESLENYLIKNIDDTTLLIE